MPGFENALSAGVLDGLAERVWRWKSHRRENQDRSPIRPPDWLHPEGKADAALWASRGCAGCHGDAGAGDGPLAAALQRGDGAPADLYDLARSPLKGGDSPSALFSSLTSGRPGTPMPSSATRPVAERWRLVAHLLHLRASHGPGPAIRRLPEAMPKGARDSIWQPLEGVGAGPPGPPTEASAAQCRACHPSQHTQWVGSRHPLAMGPGVVGQFHGMTDASQARCARCHAPSSRGIAAPKAEGVGCAGCHVRRPASDGASAGTLCAWGPVIGPRTEPRFGRSDFCLPCHNLPPEDAVNGRPLLDTWREWAASPYLAEGVQCQDCHMPDRAHGVHGAHHSDAVSRAIRLRVEPISGAQGEVTMDVTVENVGAGHYFPTTATPRALLQVRLIDRAGPVTASQRQWPIGRTVVHAAGAWSELADTRIPPRETRRWRFRAPRGAAHTVEASVFFYPDWFYIGLYRGRLERPGLPGEARAPLEAALRAAESSVITAATLRRRL